MRTLFALLLVLLLCSFQLTCRGDVEGATVPVECCFRFFKMKIPLVRIKSHWLTSSKCPIKALVFRTIVGNTFCVDPSASWVKDHLKKLNRTPSKP